MNRGLFQKTIRETWLPITIVALAMAAFEMILAYVLSTFYEEMAPDQWLSVSFIRRMLSGLLGTELQGDLGANALTAIAWVHPVILALLWGHGIVFCTRLPAGEVDRGTIDVLLSLPVSRVRLYLCESAVGLLSGLILIAAGFAGCLWGNLLVRPEFRPETMRLVVVALNLFCLYLAVGGVACLVSSLTDHRGRAISIVVGVVLVSFLLNFIAQFWEPARQISFLSVLNYHRPMQVLQDSAWPVSDMVTLLITAVVFWSAGAWIFSRRDINTV